MKKEELEKEVIDIINKLGSQKEIDSLIPMVDININHYSGLTVEYRNKGYYLFIGEPFKRNHQNYYSVDFCYLTLQPSDQWSSVLRACAGSPKLEEVFSKEYIEKSGILRKARLNTLLR